MNGNEFGRLFRFYHLRREPREAMMGCTVSGIPAGVELSEEDIQRDLDRRKPGQSMITTSRGEPGRGVYQIGRPGRLHLPGCPSGDGHREQGRRAPGSTGRSSAAPQALARRLHLLRQVRNAQLGRWRPVPRRERRSTGSLREQSPNKCSRAVGFDIRIKAHVNQLLGTSKSARSASRRCSNTAENDVRCAHPRLPRRCATWPTRYRRAGNSIGGSICFQMPGRPAQGLGAPRFDQGSRPPRPGDVRDSSRDGLRVRPREEARGGVRARPERGLGVR